MIGLLKRLFERRGSIEDPSVPLTGANIDAYARRTGRHESTFMAADRAMCYSVVHACVRIISDSVAVLPLHVYEASDDGQTRERVRSPISRLLAFEPNPMMSAASFKETLQSHLLLYGNAFAFIERDGGGRPTALWPISPESVAVVYRQSNPRDYYYRITLDSGEEIVHEPSRILHIPGLGQTGVWGYSPIALLRSNIQLGVSAEKFTNDVYNDGVYTAGVLETPEALSDKAFSRLQSELAKRTNSVTDSVHPLILEKGMKWNQNSMPSADAMFTGQRSYEKREILSVYRVPPHMVADLEGGASYASIEVMSIEFVRYSLGIWLSKWEMECTRKLLTGSQYAEFMRDAFLAGDTITRYTAYKMGREGGWFSINDIRRAENMSPVEGGDEYLQPLNMEPASSDSAEPIVRKIAERMSTIERDRYSRALARDNDIDSVAEYLRVRMSDEFSAVAPLLGIEISEVERIVDEHVDAAHVALKQDPGLVNDLCPSRVQELVGRFYQ